MEWLRQFLLLCCACLVCNRGMPTKHPENEEEDEEDGAASQEITITFRTSSGSPFTGRVMPDTVQLNLTTTEDGEGGGGGGGGAVTRPVTLFRRPDQFQRAPLYVFRRSGNNNWTYSAHVHHDADDDGGDPSLKELTWYTTGISTGVQLAACIVRVWLGHSHVYVFLKDDGLLVLEDVAYTINNVPLAKRSSPGSNSISQKYRVTKRDRHPSKHIHHTHSSHNVRDSGQADCMDVYIDVCVHVDFDLYEKYGKSLSTVRTYIKDIMNEVQVLYEQLSTKKEFEFKVHMELVKIFVETNIFMDPIHVRHTSLTQAVLQGEVYQDILKAHDLLTSWLTDHGTYDCDHYTLITGTHPASFEVTEEGVEVYSTDTLGVSWNVDLCGHSNGKHCSLLHDHVHKTSLIIAHEIGHNLGLPHLNRSVPSCRVPGQGVMDYQVMTDFSWDKMSWSPCSVQILNNSIHHWLRTKPECLFLRTTELNEACQSHFGEDHDYHWEGLRDPKLMSGVCRELRCQSNASVHTTQSPQDVICGFRKVCDGNERCVDSPDVGRCGA